MGRPVVMVHGMRAKASCFDRMGSALEAAGFRPVAFGHDAGRGGMDWDRLTRGFGDWMGALEGQGPVGFVGHSLGGLLIRSVLAAGGEWRGRLEPQRLVMLSPPTRGSRLFRALGRAASAVTRNPEIRRATSGDPGRAIPPPGIPFAVIAGGTGLPIGFNPFLPGDNDGILEVEETRDERADGFLRVRATHWGLPRNDAAIAATVAFLRTGRLASSP